MRRLGWLSVPLIAVFVFLYVPIVTLVILSFNASKLPFVWGGFSLRWYGDLATNEAIREGFVNTMIVAIGTTILATVLGTLLAHWIGRPLIRLNFNQQKVEADFRYALVRFRDNTEGIALHGGEADEQRGQIGRAHV